jgi:hypothetical protein
VSREPGAGSREPGAGSREPGAGSREPVFGLSREWLLDAKGEPFVDALVLSHPEQADRLRAACPEAADAAVLGGDPCFDRLLAARPYRERFRRALGVRPGQRLVLLNSTWNPASLFGDGGADDVLPLLLPKLAAELPADEYRVAAVLHPNIWAGHGPGQVRLWLDRAVRSGLVLVDPLEGWRQALLAAEVVLGDFGSVTYYAAALGTPVLLGAAGTGALAPDSPVAAFVRSAPRLDPYAPLLPQLERPAAPPAGPAGLTTSDPGRAAELLRALFYELIGLPEPAGAALLDPLPLPPYEPAVRTAPLRVVTGRARDGSVLLRRYGAVAPDRGGPGAGHLAVDEDTLDPGALATADVIVRHGSPADPRLGPPERWAAEVLARHPGCGLAAYVTGPATCVVRLRGRAAAVELACPGLDPAAAASAYFALGGGVRSFVVRTGTAAHTVRSRPLGVDAAAQEVQLLQRLRRVFRAQRAVGLGDEG